MKERPFRTETNVTIIAPFRMDQNIRAIVYLNSPKACSQQTKANGKLRHWKINGSQVVAQAM